MLGFMVSLKGIIYYTCSIPCDYKVSQRAMPALGRCVCEEEDVRHSLFPHLSLSLERWTVENAFRSSQAPASAVVVILEPALSTVAGVTGFFSSSNSGQVALGEETVGWVALGEGMRIIIVSGITQSPFIGCCLKVVID